MNKSSFISPMGTILSESPLFLSSPHSIKIIKRKRMHLLSNGIEGHCVAIFLYRPYLAHSNSAPTATSESVLLTGGNTFAHVMCSWT